MCKHPHQLADSIAVFINAQYFKRPARTRSNLFLGVARTRVSEAFLAMLDRNAASAAIRSAKAGYIRRPNERALAFDGPADTIFRRASRCGSRSPAFRIAIASAIHGDRKRPPGAVGSHGTTTSTGPRGHHRHPLGSANETGKILLGQRYLVLVAIRFQLSKIELTIVASVYWARQRRKPRNRNIRPQHFQCPQEYFVPLPILRVCGDQSYLLRLSSVYGQRDRPGASRSARRESIMAKRNPDRPPVQHREYRHVIVPELLQIRRDARRVSRLPRLHRRATHMHQLRRGHFANDR